MNLKVDNKFWIASVRWLIALIAFAIPIEHKYDKPFRIFSKSLIPADLSLPFWFDKKIYFYPSDIIVLLVVAISIFALRVEIKRFWEKCTPYLFLIGAMAVISIAASSINHYPIPYFRIWQLFTAFLLFGIIASLSASERDKTFKLVVIALVAMGTIQSLIGILQYFYQGPLGLHWLEEPYFVRSKMHPFIGSPDGTRWIIDNWTGTSIGDNYILRATGTFAHPNVLAGFLSMTIALTLYQFSKTKGVNRLLLILAAFVQMFGVVVSYSRSGLFGLFVSLIIWFAITLKSRIEVDHRKVASIVICSFGILAILFQNQIINRGGIVNYNSMSSKSDNTRLKYQDFAFNMILDKPLTGVGYGQFTYQLPKYLPTGVHPEEYRTGTHNIYLLMASEVGLIALASFCCFILLLLWNGLKNLNSPQALLYGIFFSFLFIGGCDFYPILFQQGRLMFFIIAGFLSSYIDWTQARFARIRL